MKAEASFANKGRLRWSSLFFFVFLILCKRKEVLQKENNHPPVITALLEPNEPR